MWSYVGRKHEHSLPHLHTILLDILIRFEIKLLDMQISLVPQHGAQEIVSKHACLWHTTNLCQEKYGIVWILNIRNIQASSVQLIQFNQGIYLTPSTFWHIFARPNCLVQNSLCYTTDTRLLSFGYHFPSLMRELMLKWLASMVCTSRIHPFCLWKYLRTSLIIGNLIIIRVISVEWTWLGYLKSKGDYGFG